MREPWFEAFERTFPARRALVFFPHCPWPPKTGAHARFLSQLGTLKRLGFRSLMVASTRISDEPWTRAAMEAMAQDFDLRVELVNPTPWDEAWMGALPDDRDPRGLRLRRVIPSLRLAFGRAAARWEPDLVLINYINWCDLFGELPPGSHPVTAVENHDFQALNGHFQRILGPALGQAPYRLEGLAPEVLDLGFPGHVRLEEVPGVEEEIRGYDACDLTLTISSLEGEVFGSRVKHTRIVQLPAHYEIPTGLSNAYADAPVFVASPNYFNIQGYLHFVDRILPLVLERRPDFQLRVVGGLKKVVEVYPGIEMMGYVDDLTGLYGGARFAVCPLLAATGQQIKIGEAMAAGLPVIAYEATARTSPIRHGESGLVAVDPTSFAEAILRLMDDSAACRRMGGAAREHMATYHHGEAGARILGAALAELAERRPSPGKEA